MLGMARFVGIAVAYLLALPFCFQGQELYFPSLEGDTVCISENSYLNLSFWFNVSNCTEPITYRLSVKTKTLKGYEEDGRVLRQKERCVIKYNNSLRCIADDGPAELYKKVNRSHEGIEFDWSWKYCHSPELKKSTQILKLNFSCNLENVRTGKSEEINFFANPIIAVLDGIVFLPVLVAAVVSIWFRCRKRTTDLKDDKISLINKKKEYEEEDLFLGRQKNKDDDFEKLNKENTTTLNETGKPGTTMNPEVKDVISNQRMIRNHQQENLIRNLADILT